MLFVGSTIGLVFRVLGAKAERDQWKNFYEKTEAEKRRAMIYLGIQDIHMYTSIAGCPMIICMGWEAALL